MTKNKKTITISIVNNKGGVGKTTTTVNLAAALGEQGYKVGIIDLDGQNQATLTFEFRQRIDLRTLLSARRKIKFEDFSPTQLPNVFILPNNGDLTGKFFSQITVIKDQEVLHLKNALEGFNDFDFLIIDCNPSLDVQALNGIATSNYWLIPTMLDHMKIDGTFKCVIKVNAILKKINPKLQLLGVLIVGSNNFQWLYPKDLERLLHTKLPGKVLKTKIRQNNHFDKVTALHTTIFDSQIKSRQIEKGQEDFTNLAIEIINQTK